MTMGTDPNVRYGSKADMRRGAPERPLYPRKRTSSAQERFGLKKRTSNVRLTHNSGLNRVWRGMSAYNPQRTFVALHF